MLYYILHQVIFQNIERYLYKIVKIYMKSCHSHFNNDFYGNYIFQQICALIIKNN